MSSGGPAPLPADRNDLAYWFPRLQLAGVPVPRTTIVTTQLPLLHLLDWNESPELPLAAYKAFLDELDSAARDLGEYPVFLRTGHGSGKHEWRYTCHLRAAGDLAAHVAALVEWSACADILGLPTSTWAVREFLRLRAPLTAFHGMPVAREFRCFIANGRLQCRHFYWPEQAIAYAALPPSRMDWRAVLRRMSQLRTSEARQLDEIATAVGERFAGENWSVDIAQREDGSWVVIDMAEAERSWHWTGCPYAPLEA